MSDESTAHAAKLLKEMHGRKEIEGKDSGEQRERDRVQCSSRDTESTQASTSSTIASKILLGMLGLTISHSRTVPLSTSALGRQIENPLSDLLEPK